jgi:dipeptidyl aminopeptidase/acylaminoacyl peptidase
MLDRPRVQLANRRLAAAARLTCLLAIAGSFVAPTTSAAETYRVPPPPLREIVEAPPTPAVRLSPDNEWMLLLTRPNLISIAELSRPELRLAGLRIRPTTNGPSRRRPEMKLALLRVADGVERAIEGLPENARMDHEIWSPDSKQVAFTITDETKIQLWVASVESGQARRLLEDRLNAAAGWPCEWLSSSDALICATVPADRGVEPPRPSVPAGPVVQQNLGKTAPARTYQDLLQDPHDEALFEHYLAAQLVRVQLDGARAKLGPVLTLWSFEASPDGRYLLVQSLRRPFSYLVPAGRFPRRVELWDQTGRPVRELADLPLQEEVPMAFGSVPTGPRAFDWRDDAPATVHWVEALDGGDARAEADLRDELFQLAAPFEGEPEALARFALRYGGIDWGDDELALAYEWWWKTRQMRTWILRPGRSGAKPELLFDYSWEDRYADPGDAVTQANEWGRDVLMLAEKGRALFLVGDGASPEGDRPFLDRIDLRSKRTERLWRSRAPHFERPVAPLDAKVRRMITRRESPEEQPNYFLRDLKSGELTAVTRFPHPTPQLVGLQKELIRYERDDGVQLTGTLYLPPGHREEDGPLPVLIWAYPQEYKSADAAGQVRDSPYRFDRVGWWSPLLFLTRGYAVLDDPALPIVGEGQEEPNDSYVQQLVAGARAAVQELARRGVGDPDRVAIGGHSYGAFMTANLLAHSDLFRAGVARSGAYNRTLTPFGFQAEERSLWEAPEIYFAMSPFMHADKIDEPILLIHGDSDSNSGTYPMQSERFYSALKGQGATARLVMLPHESHGYRARESVLHMLWETSEWLDRYVKQGAPEAQARKQPD